MINLTFFDATSCTFLGYTIHIVMATLIVYYHKWICSHLVGVPFLIPG